MTELRSDRRTFLQTAALAAGGALAFPAAMAAGASEAALHIATNQYPWLTFYRRVGRDFQQNLEASLAEVASSGVDGYEPIVNSPAEVDRLQPLLEKHGLEMRSLYVNSTLHDADQAAESIRQVVNIAERAGRLLQTKIIVTNPSPIRWGGDQDKSDEQLRTQAKSLDELGRRLAEQGQILAYHNHDVELRQAAREFHHMLLATQPEHVTLCLDAHWIYRGSGNSSVALFDVVQLYGRRITELHLRQSHAGVWTETLGEGDIDYRRLAEQLRTLDVKPHLVLEQAVENGTPNTLDAVEAHRRSRAYAAKIFAERPE